jgi:hypothetical protein
MIYFIAGSLGASRNKSVTQNYFMAFPEPLYILGYAISSAEGKIGQKRGEAFCGVSFGESGSQAGQA